MKRTLFRCGGGLCEACVRALAGATIQVTQVGIEDAPTRLLDALRECFCIGVRAHRLEVQRELPTDDQEILSFSVKPLHLLKAR